MYYTIYKITNKVNNKIYIGKHQTEDLDDGYMGSGLVLKRAIEKYGIDKFDKEILYIFDNEEQMNNMEKEIVNEEFLLREDVYNLNKGGNGSWSYANIQHLSPMFKDSPHAFTEEERKIHCQKYGKYGNKKLREKYENNTAFFENAKRKTSESMKKYLKTNENGFKNKIHTDESKRKIGKANSIHQSGVNNSNYGNCWIHNNEQKISKLINKNELDIWVNNGWVKGRKIIFD